jgi:hypothetical protein
MAFPKQTSPAHHDSANGKERDGDTARHNGLQQDIKDSSVKLARQQKPKSKHSAPQADSTQAS